MQSLLRRGVVEKVSQLYRHGLHLSLSTMEPMTVMDEPNKVMKHYQVQIAELSRRGSVPKELDRFLLEFNEVSHYKSTLLALDQPSPLSQRILMALGDLEHPFVRFARSMS
jgi:hypothetical protein